MTALRQRLIEDLQVRNYSPRTVEAYVAAVAKVAKHFQRSPDQLTNEDVRAFQVHLLNAKASWSQFNQIVSGLRFFFRTTLARPGVVEMLPYGKRPKRLPTVLSVEEVAQLLETARPGRERVLLQTAYACGLRISEVLNLQVTDIDSARMVVNVRQGKGAKDRQVPLSEWSSDEAVAVSGDVRAVASAADERDERAADGEADRDTGAVEEAGIDAHVEAQLRDASAGSGCRCGDVAEAFGSQRPVDDGALSALESSAHGAVTGSAGVAAGSEGGGEGCLSRRLERVRCWRWRT